ncbi:unnamed protein product [Haemonchus placei]|uniref:Ovule protein n=1 Tax=Haemonchus placei TaxID=6290 RepID=A0A158QNP4_HAEPC|nr:unnamed protein product [Haemonchus placei]
MICFELETIRDYYKIYFHIQAYQSLNDRSSFVSFLVFNSREDFFTFVFHDFRWCCMFLCQKFFHLSCW